MWADKDVRGLRTNRDTVRIPRFQMDHLISSVLCARYRNLDPARSYEQQGATCSGLLDCYSSNPCVLTSGQWNDDLFPRRERAPLFDKYADTWLARDFAHMHL